MSTATKVRELEVKSTVPVADPRLEPRPSSPVKIERLYANVLLETNDQQRHRRTLSAVLSFVVQCSVLGVLLIKRTSRAGTVGHRSR